MPEAIHLRKLITVFNSPLESGKLRQWLGGEKEALIMRLGDDLDSEGT